MPFSRTGMRSLQLFGPNGQLSTGLKAKSTGLAVTSVKFVNLGSPFSKFAIQVQPASTIATSAFTISLIGSLTSVNPGKVGSSKFSVLVQATSANLNAIKFSTTLTPAQWVGVRSTKYNAASGAVNINIAAVP